MHGLYDVKKILPLAKKYNDFYAAIKGQTKFKTTYHVYPPNMIQLTCQNMDSADVKH